MRPSKADEWIAGLAKAQAEVVALEIVAPEFFAPEFFIEDGTLSREQQVAWVATNGDLFLKHSGRIDRWAFLALCRWGIEQFTEREETGG